MLNTDSPHRYFLAISRMARDGLRQPMTWAHVVATSLDHARASTPEEPALLELRKEVQSQILSRLPLGRLDLALPDSALVQAANLMETSEAAVSKAFPVQIRTLAWLAEFHDGVDDWTLQAWRMILDKRRISSGHFLGQKPWQPPSHKALSSLEPSKTWVEALEELVGLDSVKLEVKRLRDFLRVRMIRQQRGLHAGGFALHQVFQGNPGTGKTSVARILAQIYKEFGFLSKGHLVETDRSGLVGQYIGATEFKTEAVIRSALGGVLFIDEAYSLVGGGSEDFGPRAIDTLVKMMEDFRNDLVVIVAGYSDRMGAFLESNSGLSSRFTRFLTFPDYSREELHQILLRTATREVYSISDQTADAAMELLEKKRAALGRRFGNAREVRNLWEQMLMLQASRLCAEYPSNEIPDQELRTLKSLDLPSTDVKH